MIREVYRRAAPRTQVAMRAATRLVRELPAPHAPYWIGQGRHQGAWDRIERDMQIMVAARARPSFFSPRRVLEAFRALKRAYRDPPTARARLLGNQAFMQHWQRTTNGAEVPADATAIVDRFLDGYDYFHDAWVRRIGRGNVPDQPPLHHPTFRADTLARLAQERARAHQNEAARARRQAASRSRRVTARAARRG